MSSRFESINLVKLYEKNGTDISGLESDRPTLKVSDHWNRKEFVVLEFDGEEITVVGDDLKRAIDNSQNTHRY